MMASVTPAAAAISLVVVAANPFREKMSSAVSMSWRRRSVAGRRRGCSALDMGETDCKSVLTYCQEVRPRACLKRTGCWKMVGSKRLWENGLRGSVDVAGGGKYGDFGAVGENAAGEVTNSC